MKKDEFDNKISNDKNELNFQLNKEYKKLTRLPYYKLEELKKIEEKKLKHTNKLKKKEELINLNHNNHRHKHEHLKKKNVLKKIKEEKEQEINIPKDNLDENTKISNILDNKKITDKKITSNQNGDQLKLLKYSVNEYKQKTNRLSRKQRKLQEGENTLASFMSKEEKSFFQNGNHEDNNLLRKQSSMKTSSLNASNHNNLYGRENISNGNNSSNVIFVKKSEDNNHSNNLNTLELLGRKKKRISKFKKAIYKYRFEKKQFIVTNLFKEDNKEEGIESEEINKKDLNIDHPIKKEEINFNKANLPKLILRPQNEVAKIEKDNISINIKNELEDKNEKIIINNNHNIINQNNINLNFTNSIYDYYYSNQNPNYQNNQYQNQYPNPYLLPMQNFNPYIQNNVMYNKYNSNIYNSMPNYYNPLLNTNFNNIQNNKKITKNNLQINKNNFYSKETNKNTEINLKNQYKESKGFIFEKGNTTNDNPTDNSQNISSNSELFNDYLKSTYHIDKDIRKLEGSEFNEYVAKSQDLKKINIKNLQRIADPNLLENYIQKFEGVQPGANLNKKVIREYVDQILDNQVDKKFGDFIVRMRDIYYKKKQLAPLKVKRRFAVGMREIEKHLRFNNVKCLFIVPNIEKIEGENSLDERLIKIFKECDKNNIPRFFGLNKFKLGKLARKKHSSVSLLAFINVEGLERVFQDLIDFGESFRKLFYEKFNDKREMFNDNKFINMDLFDVYNKKENNIE